MSIVRQATVAAAAVAAGFAGVVSAQEAAHHQVQVLPDGGQILTPLSSIAHPGDAGIRAHTYLKIYIPAGDTNGLLPPSPAGGVEPLGVPNPGSGNPAANYSFNTPASIACVYGLVGSQPAGCSPFAASIKNSTGGSNTVAIVDVGYYAKASADLKKFSSYFGLATPIFSQRNQSGTTAKAASTCADYSWCDESSLDIEWAHAMAPKAAIVLFDANTSLFSDLLAAVTAAGTYLQTHGNHKGQVSMSWGSQEFSGEASNDVTFTMAGVVYFVASGDGGGLGYPAASPNVVAVGGTSLVRNPMTMGSSAYFFQKEAVWSWGPNGGTGGGPSAYEKRPSYQSSVASVVKTQRGVPDVSAMADPYTGGYYWCSDASCGRPSQWAMIGGTSLATPIMAGIVNLAGKFAASSAAELAMIYSHATAFNDVTSGICTYSDSDGRTGSAGYQASPYFGTYMSGSGYDMCTGIGTPKGLADK